MTETKPKRRWFRFSLRGLLIAVAFVALISGIAVFWYRAQKAEYERQNEAAEAIKRNGAIAFWKSTAPEWLVYFIGPISDRVTGVQTSMVDRDNRLESVIENVSRLPDCEGIVLWADQLTSERLKKLSRIERLKKVLIYFGHGNWKDRSTADLESRIRRNSRSVAGEVSRIFEGLAVCASNVPEYLYMPLIF